MGSTTASSFVTEMHIHPLSDSMMDAHTVNCVHKSKMTSDEFEATIGGQPTKIEDADLSYSIDSNELQPDRISRKVRNRLRSTGMDEEDLDMISNRIGYAVREEIDERMDEIKSTVEDGDPNRTRQLSKIILTGIVGKFVDEFLAIMSKHGPKIMDAIVEVVKGVLS